MVAVSFLSPCPLDAGTLAEDRVLSSEAAPLYAAIKAVAATRAATTEYQHLVEVTDDVPLEPAVCERMGTTPCPTLARRGEVLDLVFCGLPYDLRVTDSIADPRTGVHERAIWLAVLSRKLERLGLLEVAAPFLRRDDENMVQALRAALEEIRVHRHGRPEPSPDESAGPLPESTDEDSAEDHLARILNGHLAKRFGKRPWPAFFLTGGGCGAGEIPVKLTVEPAGVRVRLIPQFSFEVCKAYGRNPWNTDECYGWREALTSELSLAGSYIYVADWPDGFHRSGQLRIDADALWKLGETGKPYLIRIQK